MKVYSFSGKSGTGKSYQAVNLCKQMNIESIIDDGLFICRNKVISGTSAKRQRTKFAAVQAAIFEDDEKAEEAKAAIAKMKPESMLVIGTSDKMVDIIIDRLELPEPTKRIYIEDITTEEERKIAHYHRMDMGQHVIPAPTFQIKKQFSGYFMSPMKIFKDFGNNFSPWKDHSEKSIVRPAYSYLGKYKISEKAMSDIIDCIRREGKSIYEIVKVVLTEDVIAGEDSGAGQEGVVIDVIVDMYMGEGLTEKAEIFQYEIRKKIEDMTAFNVNGVNVVVRDVIWVSAEEEDEQDSNN